MIQVSKQVEHSRKEDVGYRYFEEWSASAEVNRNLDQIGKIKRFNLWPFTKDEYSKHEDN